MNGKKMRLLEINSCNFGSTGKIMIGIANAAEAASFESRLCCPYSRSNAVYQDRRQIFIGNRFTNNLHLLLGYITGMTGEYSIIPTLMLLRKIRKFSPDIIQLHNLHNSYINLPLLFRYIKKHNIKVVWTLHDCWAFTGHCPHYTISGCEKWKTRCYDCPKYREYPVSMLDNASFMYRRKMRWFLGVGDLTIIVPSLWLKHQVEKSFLKAYPCKVINNGIDTDSFRPIESDFKEKNHIAKKMVLGVSSIWNYSKGLDIFIKLAQRQDKYSIVLVGTNESVDRELPEEVISIHQIRDIETLASIYSAADVFLNPTREEVLGLVNIEALACGTPVITFNSGGSPECIDDSCGIIVEPTSSIDELILTIDSVIEKKMFTEDSCRKRALDFVQEKKYQDYIDVYRSGTKEFNLE